MNQDKLFDYLVATNQLDEFLGYELPQEIKKELEELAKSYKNDEITNDEIQDVIMGIELKSNISYEILFNYFKEQI